MLLPALICSDLHLTANPKDAYRWELFPWLVQMVKKHRVRSVLILGDTTDAKDHHSSELTNKVVQAISSLAASTQRVDILLGNHDYLREGHAYFKFLNVLEGVRFHTKPTSDHQDEGPATASAFFLPHTKNPAKEWADLYLGEYQFVFMHQTVRGSIASNGQAMDGEELPKMEGPKIYSGDIHVPQVVGNVEYVGSPYHVHFGDRFEPRCILLDREGRPTDLHFNTLHRMAIRINSLKELQKLDLQAGDQVKVTLRLAQSEKHEWAMLKRKVGDYLKDIEVDCHGIALEIQQERRRLGEPQGQRVVRKHEDVLYQFVEREDLGVDALEMGLEILQ